MKKLLSVGLLTVGVLAFCEQPAQAWVNSRFSIGLNWHHQSANTSALWGLWRSGQIPGPDAFGGPAGGGPVPGMSGPATTPGLFGNPVAPFPFVGAQTAPAPGTAILPMISSAMRASTISAPTW